MIGDALSAVGFLVRGIVGGLLMGGLVIVPAVLVYRLRGWLDAHHTRG